MASLAAVRYSQALFELGKEEKKLDVFKKDLENIDNVILENQELSQVLKHPQVEKEDRKAILVKIFKDVDPLIINFLKLLVDRNRFQSIHEIKKDYIHLYNEFNGIEIAYVYSAKSLDDEELSSIVKILEKRFDKKIEVKTRIDETLLAGIRIKVHGEVLDNTIENQMNRMKEQVVKKVL
ncbi:F-type H+-transporting ATPase subunit delta [Breznakia sp. PF5-3]|uniref:F0F1 ATP synthase subunit delta n=1 Tax=unclassified Breznakia TaxID=2623764 RepID=UPI0024065F1C|nr:MULTISPECIES: F0F1 ATP synthase subunit delta [unclassified Breznakia]MDL2276671.1 F0F1 ATP synthase subunit delta [Breznakia sp. OttesenSCG-928-G09]MDF9825722.1 F-type H+-transporting ATPase subunit delta [Breznakia sp. PM6-1]MDF9836552.1 F-type H+-transporting ATPase subunit delta [Breznakia sp. PF5-3]MDF9838337.1 F-type H+-transporting ATPase subunit delta [Breznakia sp. PFB2-8]MDF9860371.1 F-type H+-transporting ATPase subunit delta [Breznakia sp. PH5-24]